LPVDSEQQRQITVNTFFFEYFGSLNAAPCGSDFDEHTLARNAGLLILLDDGTGCCHRFLRVIGEACIHLGRDAAFDNAKNFGAECDCEALKGELSDVCVLRVRSQVFLCAQQHIIYNLRILRHLCGRGDQRRVCGGVLRLKFFNGLEVTGIGYHDRHLSQLG
jgi:hypothetical protein